MRLAWAFFKRDAKIALSYRVAFSVELLGTLFILGIFYYIGKTLGGKSIPALEPYGGNFMAFLLIGVAFTDCIGVSLTTFAAQIREGQTTGTLEVTLMSPVKLYVILIYSSLWNYFLSAVRFLLYLAMGSVLYDVSLRQANVLSASIIFVLTVMCFMGLGILWASVIMVIKRGESLIALMSYIVILLSGVLFPSSVLPHWLQGLSVYIPLTHALSGMRLALLQGQSVGELAQVLFVLSFFALLSLAAGIAAFNMSVNMTKRYGTLSQY